MIYTEILNSLPKEGTLVAVSKTQSIEKIKAFYDLGQRVFGENKVQELVEKQELLPRDIQWHMIGHLQTNKVKYIAPFVQLIHSLDRIKLAKEINKQGKMVNRKIPCLLQIRVAEEDTKFGIEPKDLSAFLEEFFSKSFNHIDIHGIMGMASNVNDEEQIAEEFARLNEYFNTLQTNFFSSNPHFRYKSYGMSGDYKIALEQGSNMIRIGSLLFGARNY